MTKNLRWSIAQYLLNQLIAFDCAVNAVCGGSPYSTLSARIGFILEAHGRDDFQRSHPILWLIERFLNWLDPGHCCKEAKQMVNRDPKHRQVWGE
ncbi:MAG: hypothetical protein OEY01_10675 [Desulfobulbaceae bacterium]|nr:hypothetical protein [Desulfobulbaceae bacterium]